MSIERKYLYLLYHIIDQENDVSGWQREGFPGNISKDCTTKRLDENAIMQGGLKYHPPCISELR